MTGRLKSHMIPGNMKHAGTVSPDGTFGLCTTDGLSVLIAQDIFAK